MSTSGGRLEGDKPVGSGAFSAVLDSSPLFKPFIEVKISHFQASGSVVLASSLVPAPPLAESRAFSCPPPQMKPRSVSCHSPPPAPAWICPFWMFRAQRLARDVDFRAWLRSLRAVSWGVIRVLECSVLHPCLWLKNVPCVDGHVHFALHSSGGDTGV